MTRLIDADSLLGNLKEYGHFSEDDYIVSLVKDAPTFQREGWVSVEDRLPENDKTVICASIPDEFIKLFNSGKYIPATDEIFGACFVWGKWTYEPYGDYESTARVTHWQSLPAAPTDTEQ